MIQRQSVNPLTKRLNFSKNDKSVHEQVEGNVDTVEA